MAAREVVDKGGNVLTVLDVNGSWYPRTFEAHIVGDIRNVPLRGDDVVLCGVPRSGHHWMYEILHMLLSGSTELHSKSMEGSVLELTPQSSLKHLPSPRVLTTHVLPRDLPRDLPETGNVRTVYLVRDPKDVAVSWYHFYKAYPGDSYSGGWDDWLNLFMGQQFLWSSWFTHVRAFEEMFSQMDESLYHIVFYEQLKSNPLKEIQRIASFLDVPTPLGHLTAIVERCSFDNMKKGKSKTDLQWKGRDVQHRKGIVGDWKNMFTDKQLRTFSHIYRTKMKGSQLEYRYNMPI